MLMVQLNPFIIEGYLSPEYFCDSCLLYTSDAADDEVQV